MSISNTLNIDKNHVYKCTNTKLILSSLDLGYTCTCMQLGCFYYTLRNIRPAYISSLTSIFVLTGAKSSLLREFTADAILKK